MCVYLSADKDLDDYSVKWIYRLFFNNKYPKPKTLEQQTAVVAAIDNDIVSIKNLYDIEGDYLVTDQPESALRVHPDIEKYKSVKWEGSDLHIFKLTDQTFQRLRETFPSNSLIKNGSFENWSDEPNSSPSFWRCTSKITKVELTTKTGHYSAKIVGDDHYNLSQNLPNPEAYRNEPITLFAWVKTSEKEKYRMEIYDGEGSSFSDFHTGNGKWQLLRVSHNVSKYPKFIEARAIQAHSTGNKNAVVYVDGVLLFKGNVSDPRKIK